VSVYAVPDPEDKDFQASVAYEIELLAAREQAKLVVAAEQSTYEPLNITNKRVMPDAETWMIEDLVPEDANVLLSARRKTGKTTLVGNLIRSLTRREPFLGEFHVMHKYRVTLLDFEMGERMLYSWLTDMDGLMDEPRLYTEVLRGRASQFGLLDDRRRTDIAHMIEDIETDVLIVDPLGPILGANHIDENSSAVRFITGALDQLKLEANISTMVVVAHNGKNDDQGTRGHSTLEDWPDVIWQYRLSDQKDQDSSRELTSYGRVDMIERQLAFDRPSRMLTTEDTDVSFSMTANGKAILAAITGLGEGASAATIWKLARDKYSYSSQQTAMTGDLKRLAAEGMVVNRGNEKRPMWERGMVF
jgi:RecA-family ATPase